MSTVTITIDQIHPGMIIEDNQNDRVVVTEVFPNGGEGLGILVKGRNIADGKDWSRRFQDITDTVERTISGNPNDTPVSQEYDAPALGDEDGLDE